MYCRKQNEVDLDYWIPKPGVETKRPGKAQRTTHALQTLGLGKGLGPGEGGASFCFSSCSLYRGGASEILCVYLNKLLLIAVASFQLLGDSRAWKLRVFLVHL